mgnify:CR=1 FL=1
MQKKAVSFFVKVAMFAALSIVLYFISFPLPFFVPFLKVQFSNLPAYIAGFALHPVGGLLVVVIRFLIKIPMSDTGVVGELADLAIGVSSMIYQKYKTKKGAIVALIVGTICWIVTAMLMNAFVLAPLYDLPTNDQSFMNTYLFANVLPFNAILSVLVAIITFLVYKRISNLLQKF